MRRALCALLAMMLAIAAMPARAELGKDWQPVSYPWSRYGHTCVAFNGQLWMIGGIVGNPRNDIWNSTDGVVWSLVVSAAPFSPRSQHACVVFKNRLWVIGGKNGSSDLTDIWSSADGTHWQQETAHFPFSPRWGTSCVVFQNAIYMVGGGTPGNDVWRSSDGVNWTLVTASASFPARFGHGCVVFQDKLWVIGGGEAEPNFIASFSDTWSSSDGVNWIKETSNFPGRYNFLCLVFNNRLWAIGGGPSTIFPLHNVFSSADGISWRLEGNFSNYGRDYLAGAVVDGRIELIGGRTTGSPCDLLASADGAHWAIATPGFILSTRGNPAIATFNDKLWLLGGSVGSADIGGNDFRDVLCSNDGFYWTTAVSRSPFLARSAAASLDFNGRLWIIAGERESYWIAPYLNDVWSSADGTTWTQATAAAPFSPRSGHAAAVLNGRMFVIGGVDAAGAALNDIWSSSDGTSWTLETAAAPFSPRIQFGCVAFAGKLWVFGGSNRPYSTDDEYYRHDVWSSPDGKNWTQETAAANFPGRFAFASVVAGNRIWMIGGNAKDVPAEKEVWSSSDGTHWSFVTIAPFMGRTSASAWSLNDRIWVFGGFIGNSLLTDGWFSDPPIPPSAAALWRRYP